MEVMSLLPLGRRVRRREEGMGITPMFAVGVAEFAQWLECCAGFGIDVEPTWCIPSANHGASASRSTAASSSKRVAHCGS